MAWKNLQVLVVGCDTCFKRLQSEEVPSAKKKGAMESRSHTVWVETVTTMLQKIACFAFNFRRAAMLLF